MSYSTFTMAVNILYNDCKLVHNTFSIILILSIDIFGTFDDLPSFVCLHAHIEKVYRTSLYICYRYTYRHSRLLIDIPFN